MSNKAHNYTTERDRLKAVLGDDSFYCNVRYLLDVYDGKNHNLQHSVTPGLHATNLLPTFFQYEPRPCKFIQSNLRPANPRLRSGLPIVPCLACPKRGSKHV